MKYYNIKYRNNMSFSFSKLFDVLHTSYKLAEQNEQNQL